MNKEDAQKLVEAELEKTIDTNNPTDYIVLENKTIEKEWGWIFFYQSKTYIESGNFQDMLSGNAPIIVNRSTGTLSHTGTAFHLEHYLKEYEATL
jgi:hypothetical protein